MSMLHSQTSGVISSAISDRVNPEIQNFMSPEHQDTSEETYGLKTKTTKKEDSRSAFDLSDTRDLSP